MGQSPWKSTENHSIHIVLNYIYTLLTWTVVAELGTLVPSPGDVDRICTRAVRVVRALRVLVQARDYSGENGRGCNICERLLQGKG